MQLHEYLKPLRIKDPRTNQEIAQKTGISISNLSRIFSGENDNPSWLTLVALFTELKGSLDAAAGIKHEEAENLASLVGAQKQRIEDQREIIENQQRTFDFRVSDYEQRLKLQEETYTHRMNTEKTAFEDRLNDYKTQLKRERDELDALRSEMRRIRTIDTILTVALALLSAFMIYLIMDALNGHWGIIRY